MNMEVFVRKNDKEIQQHNNNQTVLRIPYYNKKKKYRVSKKVIQERLDIFQSLGATKI